MSRSPCVDFPERLCYNAAIRERGDLVGRRIRKLGAALLCICLLLVCPPLCRGQEQSEKTAEDISSVERIMAHSGFTREEMLFDKNLLQAVSLQDQASVTVEYAQGIGSLYLIFDLEYGSYTVTDNATGRSFTAGEQRFLHDYQNLEAIFGSAPVSVTLRFDNGPAKINELYLFSRGEVPDFVQQWQTPKDGETDLVLFSTHGDDEQLFFAGLLPYYAAERGYRVQVVYMTDHRNLTNVRVHEMLNGLWAVGVRAYPVFGTFPDYFTNSVDVVFSLYRNKGITEETLEAFVVEQLRRFRPKVAVGHDVLNGEYGHGMHIAYAQLLCRAVEVSGDAQAYPELAKRYGVWDVPKTYLHLYPENPIRMDWDQPLASFDGMTAYEVSKHLGFACHESQQNGFRWYISPDTAAEISRFSPCEYGLYRSLVGQDAEKTDMFENLSSYAEDAERREEEGKTETAPTEQEHETSPSEQSAMPPNESASTHSEKGNDKISIFGAVILAILLLIGTKLYRKKISGK